MEKHDFGLFRTQEAKGKKVFLHSGSFASPEGMAPGPLSLSFSIHQAVTLTEFTYVFGIFNDLRGLRSCYFSFGREWMERAGVHKKPKSRLFNSKKRAPSLWFWFAFYSCRLRNWSNPFLSSCSFSSSSWHVILLLDSLFPYSFFSCFLFFLP